MILEEINEPDVPIELSLQPRGIDMPMAICLIFDMSLLGDHTFNGEETDGNRTFSEGEGDTSKATDTEMASPRKEKKKKSGLRTPSFLKKKKKDKKKEK